jgi:hypothetical protein
VARVTGESHPLRFLKGDELMNLSKNTSLTLIAAGVVLVLIALVEHFTVTVKIVPHLAIILGVLALIVSGLGAWGYFGGSRS